ncbi:hypothetical protein [Thermotoga sp.]|uniref:hypothetical protein n=1 Tax=Thermotoga sp. TaxID=28240 RepID=UPI0025D0152B|nr:hypothetical protein [Thermotoga sp.]MCD6551375.1 hypothetical protein [Thermotoga sp.]
MRKISTETLLRRVQHELNVIRKLNPEEVDPKIFKLYLEKARVMGYLASVLSQIIEKHDLEKRIERLETILEERSEVR